MTKYIIFSLFGTAVAALFGGWDGDMTTLAIFIAIDYLTGIILAAIFKRSTKTETGKLDSRAGLKGLFRKAGMFVMVIIASNLDELCGMGGVLRTGTIFALIANESLSIIENLGLMGIPLPGVLTAAIERLHEKDKEDTDNGDSI